MFNALMRLLNSCIFIAIVCCKEITGHYISEPLSEYCIEPSNQQLLKFEVKTSQDAIVRLNSNDEGTFYEIVSGGNANRACMIRRSDAWERVDKNYQYVDNLLNISEFRQFWIKWTGGHIFVGRGLDPNQPMTVFCEWQDTSPLSVTTINLGSGLEADFIVYYKKRNPVKYIKFPGQLATNGILARETMTSRIKCAVSCSSHTRCTGFNFKKSTNSCELSQIQKSDTRNNTDYDLFSIC